MQLLPNGGDIESALTACVAFGSCLAEPYVDGHEMTVGVLQLGNELLVHPVIEIQTPENAWYDYEHRYTAGQSQHVMPAQISPPFGTASGHSPDRASQLGATRPVAADFIVTDNDGIYLLEVNALPGMTPVSLYPEGASAIGYPFEQLVNVLVQQAFKRGTI